VPAPEVHAVGPLPDDVSADLTATLEAIRRELGVADEYPAVAVAEATASAGSGGRRPEGAPAEDEDCRDLPFVTIDPAGSRDLDQAYHAERRPGGGYRIHYAIADVAWFVAPGGAVDREAFARGVTLYQPDRRTPLHPDVLGQDAASLLPDQDRRAVLWTIALDSHGVSEGVPRFRRSVVRSRRAMSYPQAQRAIDDGTATDPLVILREVGILREQLERDRGGISLPLPAQEVVLDGDQPTLRFDAPLPVEDWNAQISLLTGIVAAEIMVDAGIGVLRTLPPPETDVLEDLRRRATALGVTWPAGVRYADFVRSLDPDDLVGAVLLRQAARTLRGAGYEAVDGDAPALASHAAVASPYAHVTAPLRRLVDRFANEVLLAVVAGIDPPAWARQALPDLPGAMGAAIARERTLERTILDGVEAVVLAPRVGERFDATVVAVDGNRSSTIQITDPAVLASVDAVEPLGTHLTVRLIAADPVTRSLRFDVVR
jgi:exoribonuclease R